MENSATRILPQGTVVIIARGATTGKFAALGRDMAMNQTCYGLASKRNRPFWLNCAFSSLVAELVNAAHGSVFDTITTKTFEQGQVISPSKGVFSQFELHAKPLFALALANIEENVTLAKTRDLLLPKLMSGEIRVRDAEKIVEAAQ